MPVCRVFDLEAMDGDDAITGVPTICSNSTSSHSEPSIQRCVARTTPLRPRNVSPVWSGKVVSS